MSYPYRHLTIEDLIDRSTQRFYEQDVQETIQPLRCSRRSVPYAHGADTLCSLRIAAPDLFQGWKPPNLPEEKVHKVFRDPFAEPDRILYLGHVSDRYYAIYNKYPAFDCHFLLVTNEFEPQFYPPDSHELELMWNFAVKGRLLGFLNAGLASGCSQPHRHFQFIDPGRVCPDQDVTPLFSLLRELGPAFEFGKHFSLECWPFLHRFVWLADISSSDAEYKELSGEELLDLAEPAFEYCGLTLDRRAYQAVSTPPPPAETWQEAGYRIYDHMASPSFNFLMNRRVMLVVPRKHHMAGPLRINSLPFAGSFFARFDEEATYLLERNPIDVLAETGFAPDESALTSPFTAQKELRRPDSAVVE